MRVVVDGIPLYGTSVSLTAARLLSAWTATFPQDDLHLVHRDTYELPVPGSIQRWPIDLRSQVTLGRLRSQNTYLPRLCRALHADALLATIPSTTVRSVPCPKIVINHDLRHELQPAQFGRGERFIRTLSYSTAFRQAAAVANISERTRNDLVDSRPWMGQRAMGVVRHGADHVAIGSVRQASSSYAVAFGQYSNKHVDAVIGAWGLLSGVRDVPPLKIVGVGGAAGRDTVGRGAQGAPELRELCCALGLTERIEFLPWLDDDAFARLFAGASLTIIASDFEGFGLPVLEAMRSGMPVVYTPDPALREVAAGHGTMTAGWTPHDIAAAVKEVLHTDESALLRAQEHASTFTWRRSATQMRALIEATIGHDLDR